MVAKFEKKVLAIGETADTAIVEVAKKADSQPPPGFKRITNFYIDPNVGDPQGNIRLRIEYED